MQTTYRGRIWYEARSDSGVQTSWYILPTAEGRSIVRSSPGFRSTADRSPSARTVIVNEVFTLAFSRDAETSIVDFTRTHFTIVAPLNPVLQFKPFQVRDRAVHFRF